MGSLDGVTVNSDGIGDLFLLKIGGVTGVEQWRYQRATASGTMYMNDVTSWGSTPPFGGANFQYGGGVSQMQSAFRYARPLVVDSGLSLFLAATTSDAAVAGAGYVGGLDALVIKYAPSVVSAAPTPAPSVAPSTNWVYQVGTVSEDQVQAVTLDSAGNSYMAGRAYGNLVPNSKTTADWGAFVVKVSPTGEALWRYQSFLPYEDVAYAVTVDSAGFVYLGGSLRDSNNAYTRGFVTKLDASGVPVWSPLAQRTVVSTMVNNAYNTKPPSMDIVLGVAVDGSSNIICVGTTNGQLTQSGVYHDIFVRKLDSSGAVVWTQQASSVSSPAGTSYNNNCGSKCSFDYATGVAVDSAGSVYVGGHYYGDNLKAGNANVGPPDPFALKYNSSGALQWTWVPQDAQMSSPEYVTGLAAEDKTYDASDRASLIGVPTVAALPGDDVAIGGAAIGTFVGVEVGTNNSIT